jgi:glycosyltransferase involved in cell wall biosynthesis
MDPKQSRPDLTIIIPCLNEAENLAYLLPEIHSTLTENRISYEIVVIDEQADTDTRQVAETNQVTLISHFKSGYGAALIAGFIHAKSEYIISMDADFSHSPDFLVKLWHQRKQADILIASRYIEGGSAKMPFIRYILSKILNIFFSRGLDLHVRDMSSGYRLYNRKSLHINKLASSNFDVQQEILVFALINGYLVREIPFHYHPRKHGSSHARLLKFGIAYIRTFVRLWKVRNSIASADYDYRAYDSLVIFQRYWQRTRVKYIRSYVQEERKCLDVGCGSSRILSTLPEGSIGLDILTKKLRFARQQLNNLVQGDGLRLPFPDESIPCVICSQVIEHIESRVILDELDRILAPSGKLILGTPDYDQWQWRVIERIYGAVLPQAYADEHITHYTLQMLIEEFIDKRKYSLIDKRYILNGELILCMKKP